MSVTLRVVGNFYFRDDIEFKENMTVADVLNYARDNTGSGDADLFNFDLGKLTIGADAGKPSVTAFVARYPNGVTSRTSGVEYPEGEYYVAEDLNLRPAYTVWQYYVFNAPLQSGGAYEPQKPRLNSFVDAPVQDGGMVVWRLVSVLANKNPVPATRRQALLGPENMGMV